VCVYDAVLSVLDCFCHQQILKPLYGCFKQKEEEEER